MTSVKNTPYIRLFIGDILLLSVSLYVTLVVRYGALPDPELLSTHFAAFSVLFIVWAIIFFIAGLYDRQTLLFPDSLWQRILKTQAASSIIAVLFFYTIPFFSIAPKTNLFIFLVISTGLLIVWRYWTVRLLSARSPSRALLIATGSAAYELQEKIAAGHYGLEIETRLDPDAYSGEELYMTTQQVVRNEDISFIILDRYHSVVRDALPRLHSFLYADLYFLDIYTLYESVFDRVPIEQLQPEWFIQHIHRAPHAAYDVLKRGMDIVIAGLLTLVSLPLYPFIALAIWLQDRGVIFYRHQRIGQFGEEVSIVKFRTMTTTDSGKEALDSPGEITSVGHFLRKTRLDELPQLFNVLGGDLSLIGPRPEIPELAKEYEMNVPYYSARHLIKPGLSGWAQLKHANPPKFAAEAEKTREKLAYDLYYVKNRSFMLDIKIALWTLRILTSRSGQ